MSIDIERLRDVLEHVTAHPDEHNQTVWAWRADLDIALTKMIPHCGTAMCLAGHTVVLAGRKIDWATATRSGEAVRVVDGGRISDEARKLLGLAYDQAEALFDDGNSLADLWRIAGELTDGAIVSPVGEAS